MKYVKSTILSLAVSLMGVNAQSSADKLSPYTNYILNSIDRGESVSLSKSISDTQSSKISCYITVADNSVIDKLEALGIDINTQIGNILTAKVPTESIDATLKLDDVLSLEVGVDVFPTMDIARTEVGATKVEDGIDVASGYNGSGVIVGVIDMGIQFNHIEFLDAEDNLRIKRVWVQSDSSGTPPDGYSYGSEYATPNDIYNKEFDLVNQTHGNHVMSIAAGGYKGGNLYGIATDAELVYVCYDGAVTTISDALQYIYDYAEEVGKPVVINTSIGSFVGPRDGTSSYDVIVDQLVGEGRILVGAAGNSGDGDRHMSKTVSSATDTLKTFTNFNYTLSNTNQTVIYGEDMSPLEFKLTIYDKVNNKDISEIPLLSTSLAKSFTINFTNQLEGVLELYLGYDTPSQRSCIFINKSVSYCDPNYTVSLKVIGEEGKTIHAWDKYDAFTSNGIDGYTNGDNTSSILEVGGTANRIITVGAYTTKSVDTSVVGDILFESGQGPTVDNRVKPEVTAPGNVITAGYSNSPDIINNAYYQQYIESDKTVSKDGEDYYYGYMSGTSMASPIVTGAVAIWLQARPTLTPEEVKEILKDTSRSDSFTGNLDSMSNIWGYGKIDVWSGLKECLVLNGIEGVEDSGVDPVLFNYSAASSTIRVMVSQPTTQLNVSIYSVGGELIKTINYAGLNIGEEETLNIDNLSDGIYIVKLTTDNYTNSVKIVK